MEWVLVLLMLHGPLAAHTLEAKPLGIYQSYKACASAERAEVKKLKVPRSALRCTRPLRLKD